jgi:hypothetical protein
MAVAPCEHANQADVGADHLVAQRAVFCQGTRQLGDERTEFLAAISKCARQARLLQCALRVVEDRQCFSFAEVLFWRHHPAPAVGKRRAS